MKDIRPHVITPAPLLSPGALLSPHSAAVSPREGFKMIIDPASHSSSMPVSPKQGETITAECLSKQETQQVSSSMTPSSWEMSSQPITSIAVTITSLHTSNAPLGHSWSSTSPKFSSSPIEIKTIKNSLALADSYQADQINSGIPCDSWTDSKDGLRSITSTSSESSSPKHLLSPSAKRDETDEHDEMPTTSVSTTTPLTRSCDQPDSSPSPPCHLNSSFDETDQTGPEVNGQNTDVFGANSANLYGSFERRSRRKPTIGDIVRRVRPPVDAPPYDSEESEIEDDILQDELMAKLNHRYQVDDEVDGVSKSGMKLNRNEKYEVDPRHLNGERLSRLEAVDGAPEDDEDDDMEMNSESDSLTESDKHAFLNDVPESIYNLMHEAKVKAHTMFMKTANGQSFEETKLNREQYLLQLLSNLRDRCVDEGLKPEMIGAILKDVETEVTYLGDYLDDMKMKQYYPDPESDKDISFNGLDANDTHFLSKPNIKLEVDKDKIEPSSIDSSFPSMHRSSFFHLPSSSSPLPTSSSGSPLQSSDTKPIIVTVAADIKPPIQMMYSRAGLPNHHPMPPNINEHALSPLFSNNKMAHWLPHMSMYNFGSPESLEFARKFMSLDKISENLDKDYLKCQFCERTFRRQKNLENHIENTHQGKGPLKPRRETGDMYFKCSHCPYTTKHQSNLYVHLRIHTGERPYICGACGVQYSQSHSLKSHIINKHDGIMSFYYKEKRTRSPRGLGYLSAQVMHDSSMFKLPSPIVGSSMHPNMDIVNKAIEMAASDVKQQQQQHQQQLSPPGSDLDSHRHMMPPPLRSIISNGNTSISSSNPQSSITKSSSAPLTESSINGRNTPNSNSIFSVPSSGPQHPFFMNGHPLMFGELPPHIRNPNHMSHHPPPQHPFLPGFPHFSQNGSANFHGNAGLSPLSSLSPNSSPALSVSNNSQNLAQQLQLPLHLSQMSSSSSMPLLSQEQIKKDPLSIPSTPVSCKQMTKSQPDEAIDLRKKSPPLDIKEQHSHDLNTCGGKENCSHAAKLKYLRLNVVRMLGILVPNLNFAEKGISAESESVDELLQDVIESNTHDDDMIE